VDDGVPGEAGVVDDDVDLAVAKGGGFGDQLLDAVVLEQVPGHGQCLAAAGADVGGNVLGLGRVNVGHDHLGALVSKQPRAFGADALAGPRDDGHLARQEPLGVVELAGDLADSFRHGDYNGGFAGVFAVFIHKLRSATYVVERGQCLTCMSRLSRCRGTTPVPGGMPDRPWQLGAIYPALLAWTPLFLGMNYSPT
jgi:hypothetical protein